MSEENHDEALPKPAAKTRPYALQKRQPRPGAPNQTRLDGAPGRGADEASQEPGQAPGLSIASYYHKTPSTDPVAPPGPHFLNYYQGSSLVDLRGPSTPVVSSAAKPSKRQIIDDWSRASSTRFRQFLSTLRKDALDQALVLTLTYPHDFPPPEQFAVYKRHLTVFYQGLCRRFKQCSGVWKLEFQERGAAHFHILCFGLQNDDLNTLRAWITQRWYSIAHHGDKHLGSAACQIDPIKHHGGFINYLASYLGKTDQTRPGDATGRYWGRFGKGKLPVGELHTLELSPQQWVKVRRLARKKMEHDINRKRWSLFLKDINPRKPAPGPEYGMIHKGASLFGNRLWWSQLKSAFHSGARRLHAWHWMPYEEVEIDGHICHSIPGFYHGVTSTKILHRLRPPSRYKARNLDRIRLICDVTGFVETIMRGIQRGLI